MRRADGSCSMTRQKVSRRRVVLAVVTATVLSMAMAGGCDDPRGRVTVPGSDSTPPTAGLTIFADGAQYESPFVGELIPTPGYWSLLATATDRESGISAIEILTTATTTTCGPGGCKSVGTSSPPLPGSLDTPRAAPGEEVLQSDLAGSNDWDYRPFVPKDPPKGTSITVQVDLYARATNHLGGQALSPLVSLTSSKGKVDPPACNTFTLGWSWSATSTGEFSDRPECRAGTESKVTEVEVRLQFPPGTWTGQSVTVRHGGTEAGIVNQSSSDAFNGQDPAGVWTVLWGGNTPIHPIGLQLRVETGATG